MKYKATRVKDPTPAPPCKMTHILALLQKPHGRGGNRCWKGFLFDTIIQSEVEQFMLDTFHSDYFLTDPDELKRNDVGNMLFQGLWIMETKIHVTRRGVHNTFTIRT